MGPGCAIPASRCQIDHQVAWEDGGRTELTNLAPLCQGHHTIKHHGGWVVRQLPGGAIEWISPLGRRYVERSEEHTSELQSLMHISYAVFCLKKKKRQHKVIHDTTTQKQSE